MKREYKISIIILSVIIFLVGSYIIDTNWEKWIMSHPKKYCYHYFFGPANHVLVIESLSYRDEYIEYYNNVSKGENPTISFPLIAMPTTLPVYIMEYSSDSVLVDVASFFDGNEKYGGNYIRGWVLASTLHDNPPPKTK